MGAFVVRRAIQALFVLFFITTILFFLLRLSGDPAAILLGTNATPEQVASVRHEMGLDQPLPVQYGKYMANVIHLNFGESISARKDALMLVWQVLPLTMMLAVLALIVGLIVAFPIGIYSALHRNSVGSFVAMLAAIFGISMPSFWLGIMLILLFAVQLHWLPSTGTGDVKHFIMPVFTLSLFVMARHARLIRSGVLEVINQDYIRTARTKGLVEGLIIRRHALKNALMPVVTVLGIDMSLLVGGAVIIETVFALPGMGRQLVQAVNDRDYPLVQATVFIVAFLVVAINFFVDLVYRYLDPRVKIA